MRRVLLLAIAATGAAMVSAPALGSGSTSAVERVYEAGRCIVQHDREGAVRLMRSLPLDNGAADLSTLRGGRAQSCAGLAVGANSMLVRGAIAQEMFLRDFRGFGEAPRRPERLVDLALPVQNSWAGAPPNEIYRWADCVVRNDTASIQRLLTSPVGSAEESQALAQLQPYMAACLAREARLAVRPSEARSVFAQSAYHVMYRFWGDQLQVIRR